MLFPIHKEGYVSIAITIILLSIINILIWNNLRLAFWPMMALSLIFLYIIVQFFRNPVRNIPLLDENLIYAPADGKICVIEEVEEPEYFQGKRLQVSIFMSPFNVHVNRNPISGKVTYFKYHPGKYLVAWHPKSSTDNERTTIVYQKANGTEVLMRQIAGAVARRICWYIAAGDEVTQGGDMGFIKFGSRVDLFLPTDVDVQVAMDQAVKGNNTVIAKFKP